MREALRLIAEIVGRFGLLTTHPEAGRARDDIESGLRSFPVKSHSIYYRTVTHGILVSRVLHGKRDQGAVLDARRRTSDDRRSPVISTFATVSFDAALSQHHVRSGNGHLSLIG